MILYALNELYDRLSSDPGYTIPPPGYSVQKVTFRVVLEPDGALHAVQDARIDTDGRSRPRQLIVPGGTKPSGSGLNPCFLWDNTGYMLGFKEDDANPDRTRKTFETFRNYHLSLEGSVGSDAFAAVCRFLESWDPASAADHPVLTDAAVVGFGVFKIRGITAFVHEDPVVRRWWEKHGAEASGVEGQCLVTGSHGPLARTHGKVRGVTGTQGAGGSLVGFNEPAYESYGKVQSYNAPVSEAAAFRYVTAINTLLDGRMRDKHRVVLGDTTIAFWTDRPTPTEDIFLPFTESGSGLTEAVGTQDEAQRQRVEFFLRALRRGRPAYDSVAPDADGTAYFLLGLSPNAGRVSVRLFWTGTVGSLLDNVRRHHADIGLAPDTGGGRRRPDPEFPGLKALLRQTARDAKDIPANLAGPLMRSVVGGAPYPRAVFAAVIRRLRADRYISYLRCCVLKGYLTRNLNLDLSMTLDHNKPDPAYRLGRLFAALEKTQRDALGGNLNTTIRDSFYGTASATPGPVIPRLLRTYQHHLAKLEGGLRVNRERLVQEILAPLSAFPAHLSLDEQGIFALGYYHQTRDFYTKADDDGSAAPEEAS